MNVGRASVSEALRFGAIAEVSGTELDIAAFVPRGARSLSACCPCITDHTLVRAS